MFDRIIYISDQYAKVKLAEGTVATINLMNLHIVFEDDYKTILGEVYDLDDDVAQIMFLGEIVNGKLLSGVIRKPSLDARIRVINEDEIPLIVGKDEQGYMKLGVSPFYNDYPVYLDVNNFFSNHFAIFGNSGSGKSCGISRLFQNMFHDKRLFPYKANILLFDSSGEYYNAFSNLNSIDPKFNYRFYSTSNSEKGERLRIPIFLLNADDLALLLQATNHSQLPIIERMLKLARVFAQNDVEANNYKNHLIAKAIMTILYTNQTSPNKRNEIFSILNSCSTPQFNLETVIQGIGYTRKFRECFLIDSQGQFTESVLLTEYVSEFIKPQYDNFEPTDMAFYTLDTLEKALNFTLISEGWLRNENTYGDAVTLRVRLHSLIVSDESKFFEYSDYVSLETYLASMLLSDGKKYQIININLDDIDDSLAKVITKIFSRLVFEFAKGLQDRASIPFHIVIEEAHRYIQNDTDRFLLGYNIFERIAKEGRKYGVVLGLISQRPVELSDTVISQCSNFMIFKMNHPVDVEYIKKMVPNISEEIVDKQKTLQSGTCLGFGGAFRIPLIIKMEMPDPKPWSGNCDVVSIWKGNNTELDFSKYSKKTSKKETSDLDKKPVVIPNIPSIPNVSNVILTIPSVPHDVKVASAPVGVRMNGEIVKGDSFIKPSAPSANFSRGNNDALTLSRNTSLTDNWLSSMMGEQVSKYPGGFGLNNISAQSAIPDFTTTSAEERKVSIPTNSRSIPTSLDMVSNQQAVAPSVKFEDTNDYGKVKIVPPEPVVGIADNMQNNLTESSKQSSSGIPTTDTGKPLINLIG